MTVHSPLPDFAAARQAMVDSQLRPQGVSDRRVVEAMASVPREQFVAEDAAALAYSDRGVAIGAGRFLAAPAVLGRLLTEMAPRAGERALVVGAGTGYSAAVLAAMGAEPIALESDASLAARARELGIAVVEGPLEAGHRKGAPYDLILVDGAVEYLPESLVAQLVEECGRLGAPLKDRGITRLTVGRRAGGSFGFYSIGDSGVPPLPGFARPRAFTF